MVSTVFNLLKPAPFLSEITDPAVVEKMYKYWRIRIFYSMYAGYLFYYFSRKSLAFITPFLSVDFGLTKGDIGLLGTIFSLAYGISRFASGIICDRSNPRYFMAIGLILTGFCNILFGCFSSIIVLGIVWGLNGWFQGWGWPACAKQLTYWFSGTERGTWWSVCTTSHTIGGFVVAYLAAYCAKCYGWRFGMFIPGILCVGVGCWLLNRLRDVPQSLGLPSIETFKKEVVRSTKESDTALSIKRILLDQVLNNKYIWILSMSYFCVCMIYTAVNDWGPLYLTEMKGYSPIRAAACISWFEVGGFFGILLAGWGSDNWFSGKRVPMMVLASIGLIFAVMGLLYLSPYDFLWASLLAAIIGFLVFGPKMLAGLAAAECVSKKAASTSNGFACCFGYLGAAVAGYPLGKIAEIWGWYGFIVTLVACAGICAAILLPIWGITASSKAKPSETVSLVPETATR